LPLFWLQTILIIKLKQFHTEFFKLYVIRGLMVRSEMHNNIYDDSLLFFSELKINF
jgi:hypothetical protein